MVSSSAFLPMQLCAGWIPVASQTAPKKLVFTSGAGHVPTPTSFLDRNTAFWTVFSVYSRSSFQKAVGCRYSRSFCWRLLLYVNFCTRSPRMITLMVKAHEVCTSCAFHSKIAATVVDQCITAIWGGAPSKIQVLQILCDPN